jgi:hypothetical protein
MKTLNLKTKKPKNRKISPSAIRGSLNYMRWDHPTVLKAFEIAKKLQEWLFNHYQSDEAPTVSLAVAQPGCIIAIGEVVVYSSEHDTIDELTFDCCVDNYKEAVKLFMVPFSTKDDE